MKTNNVINLTGMKEGDDMISGKVIDNIIGCSDIGAYKEKNDLVTNITGSGSITRD